MSWMGTHSSEESVRALAVLKPGACRLCQYKARLTWEYKWWTNHICNRCGLEFPSDEIEQAKMKYEQDLKMEEAKIKWLETIEASPHGR